MTSWNHWLGCNGFHPLRDIVNCDEDVEFVMER